MNRLALGFGLLLWGAAALAQTDAPVASAPAAAPAATATPNDYSKREHWLCRPNGSDACAVELDATRVAADGTLSREAFQADPTPPVDCFYVYPTVSLDPTPNSDMKPGYEEKNLVRQQFARFAARCRVFAPVYRQVTLESMKHMLRDEPSGADPELAYRDVLDAWHYYLAHEGRGRGVVLVGHSQGATLLTRLLQDEFDGKPLQARLVSAVLAGGRVQVPEGRDVGGTFQSIPLCRAPDQAGCVIAYASFRATSPPPADAIAGRDGEPGFVNACTNPANLAGGEGELKSFLLTSGRGVGTTLPHGPWVENGPEITTAFVTVPGLLSAHCAHDDRATYLAIKVHGDPSDPRSDDITGDVFTHEAVRPRWGLHPIDLDLAMGNVLDLIATEARAWQQQRKHGKSRAPKPRKRHSPDPQL